jgi:hypothetical protein
VAIPAAVGVGDPVSTGERLSDAAFLEQAFRDLAASGAEFPIKVEGAKTLPYTAVVKGLDPSGRTLEVKLFRPLPPALAAGAWFDMVFSALGKRYEGRIALVGRDGYLQYRFQWPSSLLASDRRLWKRYPFRPRENVFVLAQDDGNPCHGLTGPLVNLSTNGLQFRVDRMIRLEDGLPVNPDPNWFVDGRRLSPLRIVGLTKGGSMEMRGRTVRVDAHDSCVHLAVALQGLGDADRELMTRLLEARERRGTGAIPKGTTARIARAGDEGGATAVAAGPAGPDPEQAGAATLRRLARRTARVLAISPEGEDREALVRFLRALGFWRLDLEPDLFAAHARGKAQDRPYRLLVVDLQPSRQEGLEAVGAVRHLEPLLRSFGDVPVAFALRQPDPVLGLLGKPRLGVVALEDPDPGAAPRVLEALLGLEPEDPAGSVETDPA